MSKDFKNIQLTENNEDFDISKMEHPSETKKADIKAPKVVRREYCLYLQPKIMKAFKIKVADKELKANEVIESLLSDYLKK